MQNRGGPVWSHNHITRVCADCLKTLSIPHHIELRDRYANNNNRPDISVFDACIGTSYDLNISLAEPWNQGIIEKAAEQDRFAGQAREELKEKKYKDKILAAGGQAKTIPLVLEHFGRWAGKPTSIFINCLSNWLTNLVRKMEASSRIIGGDAYQLLCNHVMLKFCQRLAVK